MTDDQIRAEQRALKVLRRQIERAGRTYLEMSKTGLSIDDYIEIASVGEMLFAADRALAAYQTRTRER